MTRFARLVTGIAVAATLAVSACAAQTRPDAVSVKTGHCRSLDPDTHAWLPVEWKPFLPFTDVCDVKSPRARVVLQLVAVSAERYYAPLPSGAEAVTMPKPLLFTPAGKVVGSLPYNFPDDPPFSLEVTFTEWKSGFPQRIELFLRDPTVSGDHALTPLAWDAAANRFLAKGSKRNH